MEEGLRTGCHLPLIGRDRVTGVLMLCKRSDNNFAKDDVILLEQVACQVAIAVENTWDYEQATKDRDKETKQRRYLEEEIRPGLGEIVGKSPALKTALSIVEHKSASVGKMRKIYIGVMNRDMALMGHWTN